jgi:hypothetical protein
MTVLCLARCRPQGPREAAPGYRLCWECRGWMPRNLAELVALAPDLEAALSRSNIVNGEVVSGSSAQHPMELNQAAAAVRWQIRNDLVGSVRLVMGERGLRVPPADEIAPMALWLARHTDWLAAHASAGERADEIASWPGTARGVIHPNPAKRVKIGRCVRVDCPGMLTAIVKPQDSLLPSTIVCSWWEALTDERRTVMVDDDGVEPHLWRADQWHALGRRMSTA